MKDFDLYLPSKWEESEDVERRVAMEDAEVAKRAAYVAPAITTAQAMPTKRERKVDAWEEKAFAIEVMERSLKTNGRM